jgi:hypothetical protein
VKQSIRLSIYRGGTSKGVFLHLGDLPREPGRRDALALALLGSPDPMQLDGLGGTHSSTSKLVAVGTPRDATALGWDVPPGAELVYLFAQVSIDRPIVDWRGNCGNLTSAVAGYAIREGLVQVTGARARLRLFNLNTSVSISSSQPVDDGRVIEHGDFAMPGVPGTGARIDLTFHDPASSATGRVLPTGRAIDRFEVDGRTLPVTILDVSNPVVIVRARDLGVAGTESPATLNSDRDLLRRLEVIRGLAATESGIVTDAAQAATASPAIPRVILAAPPTRHRLASGEQVAAGSADFVVRTTSMGVIHHAFTGTGLMAAAAAAAIEGTLLEEIGGSHPTGVRLAHPKGVVPLSADVIQGTPQPRVRSVSVSRTARLLMTGDAYPRPDAGLDGETANG